MHDAVPSCFGGDASPERSTTSSAAAQAGPRVATSVYVSQLGAAALTWCRTAIGLSLYVDLLLPNLPASSISSSSSSSSSSSNSTSSVSSATSSNPKDASLRFHLRPWLLWKRRGTKRFYLKGGQQESRKRPVVDFAWDLAHARFPLGGGPEPTARFFVAISIDGELNLVIGDMEEEAYKKMHAVKDAILGHPSKKGCASSTLVSRREHVVLPSSRRSYTTRACLGGMEREISIDLAGVAGGRDAKLSVALDGGRVLHVKRLRWKFRGNEDVEVDGGARVQVSWDVHRWLFGRGLHPLPAASSAAAAALEPGHAVLLFRFDREETEYDDDTHGGSDDEPLVPYAVETPLSAAGVGPSGRSGRTRKLLKTISSSSSSSASSGSGSSVMKWASAEDVEPPGSETFSLVVNLWKSGSG